MVQKLYIFKKYTYSLSDYTLKYVYKSESGFDYQVGEGLNNAKSYIESNYKSTKSYMKLMLEESGM